MQGRCLRKCLKEMGGGGGCWNVMIMAYTQGGYLEKTVSFFSNMNRSGVYASEVTFASVLGSCGVGTLSSETGSWVYCEIWVF